MKQISDASQGNSKEKDRFKSPSARAFMISAAQFRQSLVEFLLVLQILVLDDEENYALMLRALLNQ